MLCNRHALHSGLHVSCIQVNLHSSGHAVMHSPVRHVRMQHLLRHLSYCHDTLAPETHSTRLNPFTSIVHTVLAQHAHISCRGGELFVVCAGDEQPRRIVCVGFCAAGSVSTLAAAWAAVQWPTADVRCISFGAPAVGNAPFAAAFK